MKHYFIDTNVVVYANDCRDKKKQAIAIKLITRLMRDKRGVISTQVMQEYAHVALNKLGQRHDVIIRQLILLESFTVISQSPGLIRRALEIQAAYTINFWDACIVAGAEKAGCETIYSEDLSTGQFYSGICVNNPFAASKSA
jgi:predicted nucleic acid-binding protein